MRFLVLGPLRVVSSSGADVTPRGRRTLDVLAVLLLRRRQAVDAQVLLELVWGDEAVGLDVSAVHTVVARHPNLAARFVDQFGEPASLAAPAFGDDHPEQPGTGCGHEAGTRKLSGSDANTGISLAATQGASALRRPRAEGEPEGVTMKTRSTERVTLPAKTRVRVPW